MGFWVTFLTYIVTTLITELLRPEPDIENAKPASLGDFQFPTADEGRAVPVIWGTVRVNGPNIIWYGDLKTKAIKKKIKTGMFSSKNVVVGYRYFLGIDFAICRGDMTQTSPSLNTGIRRIWIDDVILRPESASWIDSGAISFNQPNFFGGKDEGGVVGTLQVYPGSLAQIQSSYMANLPDIDATILPNYRGTVHVVLQQMELGNAARVGPWAFEVRRIPNGLGLSATDALVDGHAANPANVIYEIMTNNEWGLGITDIDVAQFSQAGSVLATEGNGYGRIMDRPQKAKRILAEIQEQIDGFIVQDPISKQWQLRLVRETDYPSPVTSLPLFNESNVLEMEFTRGSWADTTNQVKIQFTDKDKDFKTTFAVSQDMANKIIQQDDNVTSTKSMPGVQDRSIANSIAWRELRTLSYPLAKGKFKADRSYVNLLPGDLCRITWPPYDIEELFVRINRIQLGEDSANEIVYDFSEDIFRTQIPAFSDPTDTQWVRPNQDPRNAGAVRIWDLPVGYSENASIQQYGLLVSAANGVQTAYDIYYKEDFAAPPVSESRIDTILLKDDVSPFTPTALLSGAIGVNEGSPNNFENDSILIDSAQDLVDINQTAVLADLDVDFLVTQPINLALINDEVIFFQSLTDIGGGQFTLDGVSRGMLDTAPAEHADNSIVWFFTEGMAEIDIQFSAGVQGFSIWAMSIAAGGQQGDPNSSPLGSPEKGVVATQLITKRYLGPSAPVNVSIDGVRLGDIDTLGDSFTLNWRSRLNEFEVRSKSQEDAHESGTGYTYNVRVYHTGVSPEVEVYNQTGISADLGVSPQGGTHTVSGYAVEFSPITSPWPSPEPFPQTYRVEIEAQSSGSPTVTSQKWTRDFTRA